MDVGAESKNRWFSKSEGEKRGKSEVALLISCGQHQRGEHRCMRQWCASLIYEVDDMIPDSRRYHDTRS